MKYSTFFIYAMEIIGTVAFASSGALMAIRKKLDLFGVLVLGVVTACGGGLIRDVILNVHPPKVFQTVDYALAAVITSFVLFLIIYFRRSLLNKMTSQSTFDRVMMTLDAIGLGIFTVSGIQTAIDVSFGERTFLMLFVGVITGCGGGLLRDIMVKEMPYIFVKHVYACASLAGGILYIILLGVLPSTANIIISAASVVVIRLLAAHFKWNLPRIS